jgi:DNA repair exonuclease SbcCD ATPase subunit
MKFIFVFILISFAHLQQKPSIHLGKMESNQCSTDIGRLNFKFKYQYTSEEAVNSFFLLNMQDQNNQKRSMICRVELEVKKKLLDSECQTILNNTKEELKTIIKDTKLEEFANKIKEFQEKIEKDGLSQDSKKLIDGVMKVAKGFEDSGLGKILKKKLGIDGNNTNFKEIYDLMNSNLIFEGNQEIALALSGISLKLLKNSIKKGDLEEKVKEVQKNYQGIKDFIQKIKSVVDLSKLLSKLNVMNESVKQFPDNYKFMLFKGFFKTIKNFLLDFDISKIKDELKTMDLPDNIKQIVGKLDFLGQIGENIQNIFKAENVQEILDSKNEIKTLVDNALLSFTNNTSLEPLLEKIIEIRNKMEEKIDLKDSATKFFNLIQSAKQLNQSISDIKEKLDLDNIIKSIREKDITELQQKINEPIDAIAEKVKEKLNDPDVKLIFEKLKKVAESKTLEEMNKSLEELRDTLKELKDKNKGDKFGKLKDIFEEIKSKMVETELFGDFKELFETTKSYGEKLDSLFGNIVKNALSETSESIKENIENAKTKLEDSINKLKENSKKYLDELKPITDKLKEIYESDDFDELKMHIKELKDLALELKDKLPEDSKLKQLLGKIIEKIEGHEGKSEFIEQIKKYITDIKALQDDYQSAKDKIKDGDKEEVKEKLKEVLDEYKKKADEKAKEISEYLQKTFNNSKLYEAIKPYAELLGPIIENTTAIFEKEIEPKLKELLNDPEKLKSGLEELKEFGNALVEAIKGTEIFKLYEDYKDKYQDYKDLIKDMNLYIKNYTVNKTVDKVRDFVKGLSLEEIKNKCADLIEELKNKINDNDKAEKVKEKVEALLNSKNLSEFKSALNELKKTLFEIAKEQSENSKLKSLVEKLQELDEKNQQKFENSETYKNMQEYSQTLNDFKDKINEIVKNMGAHSFGKLKEGIEKGFDKFKEDLIEFTDAIEDKFQYEDFKAIKDKIQEIRNSKTVGELIDHNKELKQIIKDIVSKYTPETKFKKNLDKIKEFNEKIQDKILEFAPIKEIKDVTSSLKDVIDNIMDNTRSISIQTLNYTISEIKNRLDELSQNMDDKLKSALDNLPEMVDTLEKVQEKIETLNQTQLSMCLKMEIDKAKTKSLENKLRLLEESDLLCKYDEMPSEAMALTANSSDLSILKNETYSLSLISNFSLSVESYKSKPCNDDHIQNMKKQIGFKSRGPITRQTAKKRITFKMKITIKKTYKVTNFFYIKMKIKVRYKRTSLLRQLEDVESDSFCLPADNEDFTGDESELDCFTMCDNPDDVEDIGDFTSDFIDIPENATSLPSLDNNNPGDNNPNENNNPDNGDDDNKNKTKLIRGYRQSYRKNNGNLSAGAIVGIILGCVGAFVILVGIIFLLRKKTGPDDISDSRRTESNFNLKV